MTQRRTTVRALQAVAAAAALMALSGCGAGSTDGPTSAAPTSAGPTSTPDAPPSTDLESSSQPTEDPTTDEPPQTIAYAGGESPGAVLRKPSDADRLTESPASFRRFIAERVREVRAESTCSDGAVGVTVWFVRADGYASGGVNDCGGYVALWATVDGEWTEIDGTQELWGCGVLEEYAVPSDVAGDACYDYDAQKQRAYHQA